MDPPSATGNDPLRSMDIVIVTHSSIMIYQNGDGAGTFSPSDMISLQPSAGTTTVTDWALSEQNLFGTIASGNYTNTWGDASQYIYEELREKTAYSFVITVPKITGTDHTAGETLEDMWANNDSRIYTVLPSKTVNITHWDNTDLDVPKGEITVRMIINYTATGYAMEETIPLEYYDNLTGQWKVLAQFGNGAGYMEIPLNFITKAIDLADFNVRYVNSATGTLNLDVMTIRIDYPTEDTLEHIWNFTTTAGTGYSFHIFTAINASADGDAFKFQYSKNKITWTDLVTVTNTEPLASITTTLNGIGGGALYIRVISTGPATHTPSNDWIKVGQMYISCTATLSKIGKSIQAFDIGDLDGDGSSDIVVSTTNTSNEKPDVWALYNRDYYTIDGGVLHLHSGIFNNLNIRPIVKALTSAYTQSDVKNIEIGRFFGNWNDTYLDIVIRAGNSIYYIDQTSKGTFSPTNSVGTLSFLSGMVISTMLAEDIDGNDRTDLVFGTTGGDIILWANYGGTTTTTGYWAGYSWQRYYIDGLGEPVNCISGSGVAA
jgi:hypothetical protein